MNEQTTNPRQGFLSKITPERRIYIRTDNGTRYLSLSPASQIGITMLTAGFLGWSAFTSTAYIGSATDARRTDAKLETMREAFEARLAASNSEQRLLEEKLENANSRADLIGERLSEKQRRLVDIANTLQETDLELTTLREAYASMFSARKIEQEKLAELEKELAGMRLQLAETQTSHDGMTNAMKVFTQKMNDVIDQRDTASVMSNSLSEEVAALQTEIARWEGRQERVISQLEEAARTSMSALEKVFEGTNINLDRILAATKRDYTGSGGPFEPVILGTSQAEEEEDIRVAALMTDLERINLMRIAAERLPFGKPVEGARKTSGFGIRRDPIRRRASMHSGVDFAAPRGTPIYATAEGVVTFAGRQSGYGKVVKIRHAFGFETVYAHLNRARVEVGQHVMRGDRIADMGSTGRSTGSHLHYEVRIDKEPVNPAKFIEAARDVL
ncbi:peptidoglycan DD-metalloendopeptidase family protein [Rhodobacteraceae bacterium NNCM2]|nr:peptidoglycan DD-metalloendopeptidase family protein [Coraliihabitans acroporae]